MVGADGHVSEGELAEDLPSPPDGQLREPGEEPEPSDTAGPALVLVLGVSALVTGITAFRKGERSFVLWVGLVPGILFGLLLIAEILFME